MVISKEWGSEYTCKLNFLHILRPSSDTSETDPEQTAWLCYFCSSLCQHGIYLRLNLFALLLLNSFSSSICQNSYLKYIFDNLRRFFKVLDAVDREFKITLLNMLCNEMKPAKKKFKHTYCTDSRLYLLTNEKVNTSRIAKREYIKNCKKRC